MHKTVTLNDLIRFAYEETDAGESQEINALLSENEDVAYILDEVKSVQNKLHMEPEVPSASVVNSILNYSKSLQFTKMPMSGLDIEVILN